MITVSANEILAALTLGAHPALLRGLEPREQRELVSLVVHHVRARRDAIGLSAWLADQLRRRGARGGLADLVRRLEDRRSRGRIEALELLGRARAIMRAEAPEFAARAFADAGAPELEPPVRLATPGAWDARPGPGQLVAFHDALRITAMVGLPLPAGAALVSWFEPDEISEDTLGGCTWPPGPPPVRIYVAVGLSRETTVSVLAHELEHVRQLLAGRRASLDREAMEYEADVFAALVVAVWRMEQRERMHTSTPRSLAG